MCVAMVTGAAEHIPAVAAAPDTVDVSLISNKLRCLGQRSAVEVGEGSAALVLRSDAMAVTTVGADTAGECLTSKYSHCCAFRRETWLNLSKLTSLRRSPCFSSIPRHQKKMSWHCLPQRNLSKVTSLIRSLCPSSNEGTLHPPPSKENVVMVVSHSVFLQHKNWILCLSFSVTVYFCLQNQS